MGLNFSILSAPVFIVLMSFMAYADDAEKGFSNYYELKETFEKAEPLAEADIPEYGVYLSQDASKKRPNLKPSKPIEFYRSAKGTLVFWRNWKNLWVENPNETLALLPDCYGKMPSATYDKSTDSLVSWGSYSNRRLAIWESNEWEYVSQDLMLFKTARKKDGTKVIMFRYDLYEPGFITSDGKAVPFIASKPGYFYGFGELKAEKPVEGITASCDRLLAPYQWIKVTPTSSDYASGNNNSFSDRAPWGQSNRPFPRR